MYPYIILLIINIIEIKIKNYPNSLYIKKDEKMFSNM